ncbi:hypothetical protein [Streptomyces sp. NBC_00996]|uniref:hypothetical protein n=1 Tax=Streptomyces sp. NBC_00996 TaxID=2903710 RepID=UPI00386B97B9|nr:hypothetical protein OG390_49120 [Streptomyces sp. NBC_00996]
MRPARDGNRPPQVGPSVGLRKLDQAHRVLRARLVEAGGEGETLNSVRTMLCMASEYAGSR